MIHEIRKAALYARNAAVDRDLAFFLIGLAVGALIEAGISIYG